jgi:sugar lactone lactonase YvrE
MSLGRVAHLDGDRFTTLADGLAGPIGLRELDEHTLLVGEEGGQRVGRIDRGTGARTTIADRLGNVTYVDVGPDRAIYASTFTDLGTPTGAVLRITPDGVAAPSADPYATQLLVPEGILFDGGGRLVVAEWGAPSHLSSFVPHGASAEDRSVVAQGFAHLYGVARAGDDGFFVADVGGDRVAQIHRDGSVEDVLVDVAAPAGLWVAKNGDLLVAEHVDGDSHVSTGYLIRVSAD